MPLPKAPVVMKKAILTNGSFRNRPGGPTDIKVIVLHQTCSGSLSEAMPIRHYFQSLGAGNRVSAHYVLGKENPRCNIVQCVPDEYEAWHAGAPSSWHGRENVNAFSIGIEIVDDGDGRASDSWPDRQIQALAYLLRLLFGRHHLDMSDVTEHHLVLRTGERSDLTPDFPWVLLKKYVKTPPWK